MVRRAPLTRDRVLRAAIELADADGLPALTMRGLAARLGVEAMSLYHHVSGKAAMISGACDLVFADLADLLETHRPVAEQDWRDHLRHRILTARDMMQSHPWVARAMEQQSTMTPAIASWIDGNVAVMHAGGLSYDLIHRAMHTLGSRQFGFSQELVLSGPGDDAAGRAVADRMPHLTAMLLDVVHDDPESTLGWCDDRAEFEFAIDLLLDGLERRR